MTDANELREAVQETAKSVSRLRGSVGLDEGIEAAMVSLTGATAAAAQMNVELHNAKANNSYP